MDFIVSLLPQSYLLGALNAMLVEAAKRIDALPVNKDNARQAAFVLNLLSVLAMAFANGTLAQNTDAIQQLLSLVVALGGTIISSIGSYHLFKPATK